MSQRLFGVMAALVTPMTSTEALDLDTLAELADHLVKEGLHGLIPLGSTGEFYALTPQERQQVLEVTIKTVNGRIPVLAGANAGSTQQVIYYCRQAECMGAQGVMLAAPYYSRPTLDELFEHFKAVNDAIGIPIMLYNYPGRTGVDMTPEFVERLTSLGNIRYIKESTGQMDRITSLIRRCGDCLGVFCGCDTIALECLLIGAVGWVGGVANVLPRIHRQLYDLVVTHKDCAAASRLFYRMLPVLELAEGSGRYTQLVKAGCGLVGHPVGPPRRPLGPLANEDLAQLGQLLQPLIGSSPGKNLTY